MSVQQSARRLAKGIRRSSRSSHEAFLNGMQMSLRKGKIMSSPSGGVVSLQLDKSTTIAGVHYLASYTPVNGDFCWVIVVERDLLIIGKQA